MYDDVVVPAFPSSQKYQIDKRNGSLCVHNSLQKKFFFLQFIIEQTYERPYEKENCEHFIKLFLTETIIYASIHFD